MRASVRWAAVVCCVVGAWTQLGCLDELADRAGIERVARGCDIRTSQLEARPYCQEWRGLLKSPSSDVTPRAVCNTLGADFLEGPCPSQGIIAGCYIGELGDGSKSYHWYYPSEEKNIMTADDVKRACEGGGDTFVMWTAPE